MISDITQDQSAAQNLETVVLFVHLKEKIRFLLLKLLYVHHLHFWLLVSTKSEGPLAQIKVHLDYLSHLHAPVKSVVLSPHVQPSEVPIKVGVQTYAILVLERVLILKLGLTNKPNRTVVFSFCSYSYFCRALLRQRLSPLHLIVVFVKARNCVLSDLEPIVME